MMKPNQLVLVPPGVANFRSGLHRIVLASQKEDAVALFWIGNSAEDGSLKPFTHCRKPRVYPWDIVAENLGKGLFQSAPEIQIDEPTNRQRETVTMRKRYEANREILTSLVDPETLSAMLCGGRWNSNIKKAATKHLIDITTVLRLLARFFTLCMDVHWASEDRYWVKGKRRNIKHKLGRPSMRAKSEHRPSAVGRNVTEDDKESIKVFYESLENQSISQAEMYRKYEENFRPNKVLTSADGGFKVSSDATESFITERQFRYTLAQVTGQLALLQAAAGKRRIQLSHRPALGSARDRIPYPGHTYVVDATVGDIYLVSSFDRRRLIGRPVIYLVVDAFSSLIVGLHVALEGPNLDQARIALYRAIADKSRWLAWLGVSDLHHLLPQGCVPTFWLADRGELHSKGSYGVQLELRTNLSIAAAYRADWKSLVERMFGILNTHIHWLPGAVVQRDRERGTRDCRLDAVLTLKEFTRLLVRRIAILNLTRDMSQHLSATFMTNDVTPNPLGFWNYGIANKHGSATFLDHQAAMRKTLLQKEAMLTRYGVLHQKIRHTAPWMLEHPAVQLAGFGNQLPIKLIDSPDDPSTAWCLLPDEAAMREVQLQKQVQNYRDFSSEDFMEMSSFSKSLGQDLADDTADERLAIQRASSKELEQAQADTAAANRAAPVSKRAKTTGVRANRMTETASRGMEEIKDSPALPVQNSTADAEKEIPTPTPVSSETQEYFERMSEQLKSWTLK
ncbi:hypothetical protein AZ34_02370 [Hylemonella gracilis str. Niagara R]|uniref:Transposase n=1 Tax=Hylemonella gracilis str. Niagara R TaxID=1458275 RepID=A0A016XLH6_9BURK|nr:hypothetical protein [Hylemonella gracilis]EYC52760.1 hypothetical protein AZ34_02370 [Hylemonella gracilis str. Niagara R]